MQFVEGETLAEMLDVWSSQVQGGGLPLDRALGIARQIAEALEAAHDKGIVHRDLKPANIQVARDGQVKLLDFGLARILDDAAPTVGDSAALTQQAPTQAGRVIGTAPYMSPEQARGERVDRRTDIWSFGCVLYEMLSGRMAFAGDSLPDVMAAVVGGEPDWSRLPPATPARVRDVLRLCLRKETSERLRDIGDARLQLDSPAFDAPGSAAAPSARTPVALRLIPWSLAAASLVVAGLAVTRSRATPERPDTEMRFSAVTNFAGVEAQPSFSPDGRSIAYISNRGGQWDVYVGLVSGGSPVRVTNDGNLEQRPRWSPDGSKLAFGRVNEKGLVDIWVVPALGGNARRIITNARYPAWSPDGRQVTYASGGMLWLSDASGANPRAVTRSELPVAHFQPAFSHDGRSLAFLRRRDGPYAELAVVDVATGAVRELTHDRALALSPVWSPDGRFIYFSSSRGGTLNIWKMSVASGEARLVTAGVGEDAEIDLAHDGTRLVFSTYRANVNLGDARLQGPSLPALRWLTSDSARGEAYPRYSPDGRHIAYFTTKLGAERETIWVMDEDGGNPTRLVDDERASVMPRWTPDSEKLVYLSRVPGIVLEGELRRIPITGGAPESLGVAPSTPLWGDVAPDGRLLVRVSATSAEIVDTRTRERVPVPGVMGEPRWSYDGRIAYVVRPEEGDGLAGLWAGRPGDARRVLEGWVTWCAWTRAGDLLAVAAKPDIRGDLWRLSPDGHKVRVLEGIPLTSRPQNELLAVSRFDVHPDGSRIVFEAFEYFEADISMIENVP
jgi:Tol biopolymer transport system component